MESITRLYTNWSKTYHDEYYGENAPFPPVHKDILIKLLKEAGRKTLLDAGCGPASFLRYLTEAGIDFYGFDLTPEMVNEAKRELAKRGVSGDKIWVGSVLDPKSFRPAKIAAPEKFDAVICSGVMPHIPEESDVAVIENLCNATKANGIVVLEARNAFFSLFTLNRYSCEFFLDSLVRISEIKDKVKEESAGLEKAIEELKGQFRMDLPPVRAGDNENPGYDNVLSRTHNPMILERQFKTAGLEDVRLQLYHYHCLPPMLERYAPDLFKRESLAMENPDDWRGIFMASAFFVVGKKRD